MDAIGFDEAKFFSSAVLTWYPSFGRHSLPWQESRSLYHVWISEVMLQQTQVKTVIPYFKKFITTFPTVRSLAEAELDEVFNLWSGLGYYRRAAHLHQAAQKIMRDFNGAFPRNLEGWLSLPGVGRSTAGAVLSLSLGQRHPILDGNVRRILRRFFYSKETTIQEKQLWLWAEQLVSSEDPKSYNQGLMDIGAMICLNTQPKCALCPLNKRCHWKASGISAPQKSDRAPKVKSVRSHRDWYPIVQRWGAEVRLVKVPPWFGIWQGLWYPPGFLDERSLQEALGKLKGSRVEQHPAFMHRCTHLDLRITPTTLWGCSKEEGPAAEGRWFHLSQLEGLALPAPIKRWFKQHCLAKPTHKKEEDKDDERNSSLL